jgi:hypothetical protein
MPKNTIKYSTDNNKNELRRPSSSCKASKKWNLLRDNKIII